MAILTFYLEWALIFYQSLAHLFDCCCTTTSCSKVWDCATCEAVISSVLYNLQMYIYMYICIGIFIDLQKEGGRLACSQKGEGVSWGLE